MTERHRVYQVSANRERASHKLRYVERSVASDGECRLCVGVPTPEHSTRVQDVVESPQRADRPRPNHEAPEKA